MHGTGVKHKRKHTWVFFSFSVMILSFSPCSSHSQYFFFLLPLFFVVSPFLCVFLFQKKNPPFSVRVPFFKYQWLFLLLFFIIFSKWFRAVNKIFDSFSLLLFLLNIFLKLNIKMNLVTNET